MKEILKEAEKKDYPETNILESLFTKYYDKAYF